MLKKGILWVAFALLLGVSAPFSLLSQPTSPTVVLPGTLDQGIVQRILYEAAPQLSDRYGYSHSCMELELLFNRGVVQIRDLGVDSSGSEHVFEVALETNPVIIAISDI